MATGLSSNSAFQFEGRNVRLVERDGEQWLLLLTLRVSSVTASRQI